MLEKLTLIFFTLLSSTAYGQCQWGNCIDGFGSFNNKGVVAQGFFKDYVPQGIMRMSNGSNWDYSLVESKDNRSLVLTETVNEFYLFFLNADGDQTYPIIKYNKINQNTDDLIFEQGARRKPPSFNGNKTGCIAGDCKNGYGEYRFENGTEFHGLYSDGLARGGMILYPKGLYLGEVSAKGQFKKGIGYLSIDDWVYFGKFNQDKYEGQGFKLIIGKFLQGGIYAKGELIKNEIKKVSK